MLYRKMKKAAPELSILGFGCCFAYVCLDHAENFVCDLKPGEKLVSGECYFERFDITDLTTSRHGM